jgi:hypothetical protein
MYILYEGEGGNFDKCGGDIDGAIWLVFQVYICMIQVHIDNFQDLQLRRTGYFAEEYHLDPHQTYHFQVETIVVVILTLAC